MAGAEFKEQNELAELARQMRQERSCKTERVDNSEKPTDAQEHANDAHDDEEMIDAPQQEQEEIVSPGNEDKESQEAMKALACLQETLGTCGKRKHQMARVAHPVPDDASVASLHANASPELYARLGKLTTRLAESTLKSLRLHQRASLPLPLLHCACCLIFLSDTLLTFLHFTLQPRNKQERDVGVTCGKQIKEPKRSFAVDAIFSYIHKHFSFVSTVNAPGTGLLGGHDALGLDRMGALQDAIRAEMHVKGAEGYTSSRLWRRVLSSTRAAESECRKALGKQEQDDDAADENEEEEASYANRSGTTDGFRDWYIEAFLHGFADDLEQLESNEGKATDPHHIISMLDEGKDAYSEVEKLLWLGRDAHSSSAEARALLG